MSHEEYIREIPGSRRAVVMIHGILGTPRHFDFLLPLIPEDCSVYNLLLDGHGGSVTDFSHTSMKKWKAQVTEKLDDVLLRYDEVILVSHSMGTLFSIQEAVARPDKISHLFLLQIPLRPRLKLRYAFYSVLMPFGIVPKAAEAMKNGSSLILTRKLWQYLGWIPRFLELFAECRHTRKIMGMLTVPCQVFQSRLDEMVSPKSCKDISAHPHYQMKTLQQSGHFAYMGDDLSLLKSEFSNLFT